jgi:thiol-disulfide isomerase/thioredoxin
LLALLTASFALSFGFKQQTASASTQKVVLAELFTATWCGYCPYATQAINKLADEYGSSQLLVLQYHPSGSDPFGTAEADAEVSYYNVTGFPTIVFDGVNAQVGGYTGNRNYNDYKAAINSELQKSTSVSISLSGSINDFIANVTTSGSFQSTAATVKFVVYEDNVPYNAPNGENVFRFTVRSVLSDQAVTLVPGQAVSVERVFQPQADWNGTNLGLVVFVQRDDTKEVLQATTLSKPTMSFALTVSGTAKTAQVNQITNFSAVLTNTCAVDDSYNVTITKSLPAGWAAGFCTGTMCYLETGVISVKSGCSQNISIYIASTGSVGTGKATLDVVSMSDPAITSIVTTPEVTLVSTSSPTPTPTPTTPEIAPTIALIVLAIVSFALISVHHTKERAFTKEAKTL